MQKAKVHSRQGFRPLMYHFKIVAPPLPPAPVDDRHGLDFQQFHEAATSQPLAQAPAVSL